MKTEEKITQNLKQKIGGLMAGYGGDKIKQHIVMLDWVLIDDMKARKIEEIVKDYE